MSIFGCSPDIVTRWQPQVVYGGPQDRLLKGGWLALLWQLGLCLKRHNSMNIASQKTIKVNICVS